MTGAPTFGKPTASAEYAHRGTRVYNFSAGPAVLLRDDHEVTYREALP